MGYKIFICLYFIFYFFSYVLYIKEGGYGHFSDIGIFFLSLPWNLIMAGILPFEVETNLGAQYEILYHVGFILNLIIILFIGLIHKKIKEDGSNFSPNNKNISNP